MKAAVINNFGEIPQCVDFTDPQAGNNEILVNVKASVLENFDKGVASGQHYSSMSLFPRFPAIVGTDGVGTTADGKYVGFRDVRPPYGAYAEQTVAAQIFPIPDGIDAAKAAAIPSSTLTSLLPLKYSAKLQKGETVLIHGATGVSGRIAVQIAKLLGAGKVIATGRNTNSLNIVSGLGADKIINLNQADDALMKDFIDAGKHDSIDVVIDFIWGRPAELLINTFIPHVAGFAKKSIRYIQIGMKAGTNISLHASTLRTSGLQLMGIGQISKETLAKELTQVWDWIKDDKLYMEIEKVPLPEISTAWQRDDLAGKRLVIVP